MCRVCACLYSWANKHKDRIIPQKPVVGASVCFDLRIGRRRELQHVGVPWGVVWDWELAGARHTVRLKFLVPNAVGNKSRSMHATPTSKFSHHLGEFSSIKRQAGGNY